MTNSVRLACTHLIAAVALSTLAGTALAARGDAAAGANKAKPCAACHGTDFNATADGQYPRLAGQYPDYIARVLHEYKDGGRSNPIMKGMATPLSDQDIADIAAYVSTLPGKLHDLSRMKH